MITKLLELMFGLPIKGEPLSKPTFKTITPEHPLTFEQWVNDINFGRQWLTNVNWKDRHRRIMNN